MVRTEHAVLLRDFVNTLDLEQGTDAISTPAQLAGWLRDRDLIPAGARPGGADLSRADLSRAHRLRAGLRTAMARPDPTPPALTPPDPTQPGSTQPGSTPPGSTRPGSSAGIDPDLDRVLAELPLRVRTGVPPRLEPCGDGVRGGLAWIAVALAATVADGSWPRLKICTETSCQWAFIDESKNRSRHWCSMAVCGNRTKTRSYRARQRGAGR